MKEVIAMHGWGGDSNRWKPWIESFKKDDWTWQNGERGYGDMTTYMPNWRGEDHNNSFHKRVVICHSLGSHLIDQEVLQHATHVVLLSSFSRFIPEGKASRSVKIALEGMQQAIGTPTEKFMFSNFLKKSIQPHTINSIPGNPIKNGLSENGRKKLQEDLQLLTKTNSLSPGIPTMAKVLVVFGEYDSILNSFTQENLISDLLRHLQSPPTQWTVPNEGHALLDLQLITRVKDWLKIN